MMRDWQKYGKYSKFCLLKWARFVPHKEWNQQSNCTFTVQETTGENYDESNSQETRTNDLQTN